MCNRYRMDPDAIPTWAEYAGYRNNDPDGLRATAKADVWPGNAAAIVRTVEGAPTLGTARWGFPTYKPRKAAPKEGQSPFVITWWTNARQLDASLWKQWHPQAAHRCLVPFTTFSEPSKTGGMQNPHWFATERPVACFAGLWKESKEGDVFAFLTCEPNPLVGAVHPKAMPVVLAAEDEARWLAGEDAPTFQQQPYPSQLMSMT